MKHSNWILGIGIIVAVILITSTLLLKAETKSEVNTPVVSQPISAAANTAKTIVLKPLKEVTARLLHIN